MIKLITGFGVPACLFDSALSSSPKTNSKSPLVSGFNVGKLEKMDFLGGVSVSFSKLITQSLKMKSDP